MHDLAKVRGVVLDSLKDVFSGFVDVRLLDVRVAEDDDTDGNRVLLIDVIFEGDPKNLDARKLTGVVRQLRPKLDALNETAFPLLSFIAKSDMRSRKRATA